MNKYDQLMDRYPILFCQRHESMMNTCMCWGIQADYGWYQPLNQLCGMLQSINKEYAKYNVRIQANQVKQKYGTLHFYYSVRFIPPLYKRILAYPFNFIYNLISKHVIFNFERIIIKPQTETKEWVPINKQAYEKQKKRRIV